MNVNDVWIQVLKELQKSFFLSGTAYAGYIKVLTPITIIDNTVIVMGPNLFTINVIKRKYFDIIMNALEKINQNLTLKLIMPDERENYSKTIPEFRPDLIVNEHPRLNPKYTFENFVVGDSNSFAHATSVAISQNPGNTFNPFFIYGKSGLGKTHLMHAICHEILNKFPDLKVKYVSCEQFTNEMINSIKTNQNQDFRNRYRNQNVLMIDDIQFLENKEAVQEEFFHTFNSLYANGSQIVVASDRPPKDIRTLNDRLVNRFESGVVADVTMPEFKTRLEILEMKAHFEKYKMPPNILKIIAENVKTSIRELEGALTRVNAYSVLKNMEPSEEFVIKVLEQMKIDAEKSKTPSCEDIIRRVAKEYNLTFEQLIGRKKTADITLARHIAMYIAREITDLSYPNIGANFQRDHSSVIYACDKINQLTDVDPILKRRISALIKELK